MTASSTIAQIQTLLGTNPDGVINLNPAGETLNAFCALAKADPLSPWPPPAPSVDGIVHHVLASNFADARDLARFQACKLEGRSDEQCFAVGDNCIGKWGDPTGPGTGPKCALPPEVWEAKFGPGNGARHAKVLVTIGEKSVVCEHDDTMPHLADIHNGAGIDLNSDACAALEVQTPLMAPATWQWA